MAEHEGQAVQEGQERAKGRERRAKPLHWYVQRVDENGVHLDLVDAPDFHGHAATAKKWLRENAGEYAGMQMVLLRDVVSVKPQIRTVVTF